VNNDSGIMAVFNMDISRVNGATGVAQRPWPRRANMVRSKTALTRVKHRDMDGRGTCGHLTDADEMLNKGLDDSAEHLIVVTSLLNREIIHADGFKRSQSEFFEGDKSS
jgi:hypothetical protein